MAKNVKPKQEEEQVADDKRHVRVGHDGVHINGHPLNSGHIVALNEEDIQMHRNGGVALHDVNEDDFDMEDFVDVSEPYVAEEGDGA